MTIMETSDNTIFQIYSVTPVSVSKIKFLKFEDSFVWFDTAPSTYAFTSRPRRVYTNDSDALALHTDRK